MYCPANTEVTRTTPKPVCILGAKTIDRKPNSMELICRSIGAQPKLPTCAVTK
jgi:hypothetical protein